ncbi:hypothetical protein GGR28_002403 [Lewinella aquimaris]|uniref:Lipoprotein n=1 Tax=Neolewinella aquimaris TaxID=1835722 RepID=A0A840EFS5_9BACT|nr:hypothetical protein [Neolewinella aquimaris]MBB4079776.1 hypothetical protein [Neolewinella aquimaris]
MVRILLSVVLLLASLAACTSQEVELSEDETLISILKTEEYRAYRIANRTLSDFLASQSIDLQALERNIQASGHNDPQTAPTRVVFTQVAGGGEYYDLHQKVAQARAALHDKTGYNNLPQSDRQRLYRLYQQVEGQRFSTLQLLEILNANRTPNPQR